MDDTSLKLVGASFISAAVTWVLTKMLGSGRPPGGDSPRVARLEGRVEEMDNRLGRIEGLLLGKSHGVGAD